MRTKGGCVAKISYDGRSLMIDGKREMILSGSIHYPRSTASMWRPLMETSKKAGLNTVDTYVFWNLHEARRNRFDFTGNLDLLHFLQTAKDAGVYVILRVGPYICAEINYGGFPAWLRDVPGIRMRTWNEPFMREMERWLRFICDYVKPYFASHGGPVILAQIENEYSHVLGLNGENDRKYLDWCRRLADALDIGIPWIMCAGAAAGVMETINDFYGHKQIEDHRKKHPDQPQIWTENWPSWYDVWGYPHHRRSAEDVAYGVACFFARGGTGVNYYMWHGGTNFGRSAMYLQTTSYDFDGPIDEYGLISAKGNHLGRLHRILTDNRETLLGKLPEPVSTDVPDVSAFRFDGSLLFVCNDGEKPAAVSMAGVRRTLKPKSAVIAKNGKVLMDTAEIDKRDSVVRTMKSTGKAIGPFSFWREPLPEQWPADLPGAIIIAKPIEQLLLTQDRTDYCWYCTTVRASGKGTLSFKALGDLAYVFVNGKLAASTPLPLQEERGKPDGEGYAQSFELSLKPGTHQLSVLSCAIGMIKHVNQIGGANQADERKGIFGDVQWNGKPLTGKWVMRPGLTGEIIDIPRTSGAGLAWKPHSSKQSPQPLTWWKARFRKPASPGPWALDLAGMSKGLVWVNGHCLGRYWLINSGTETRKWLGWLVNPADENIIQQRYYHLPEEWLQEENTVVMLDENRGEPEKIRLCTRS